MKGLLSLALASSVLLGCNVVSPEIERTKMRQLENVNCTGFIAGFEGLQPWSGDVAEVLTKSIASETRGTYFASTGGHEEYMRILQHANKLGKKVTILGYSLGGQEAVNLAEDCKKKGINVDLVVLDWAVHRRIPGNVKNFIYVEGGIPYQFRDKTPTKEDLENPRTNFQRLYFPNAEHLQLPRDSRDDLIKAIKGLKGSSCIISKDYIALVE